MTVTELPVPQEQPLDAVEMFLSRFVAFPSEAALVAAVLWVGHTHLLDAFDSSPRLAVLSPEPGSGKTRLLEILELLVPSPQHAVNASPAALFRLVGGGRVTVLFDEVDSIFGSRAAEHEDLRGLLNAGHRRGATVLRCVVRGKEVNVEAWPSFAPVALAGLGDLPDTLMSRSIVLRMRRRGPNEQIDPFRRRLHERHGHEVRDQLAAWAATYVGAARDAWPEMPDGIDDRPADCWEPLLAVADVAGGDWPDRGRVAAVSLVTQSEQGPQTLGVQLLADLRRVFDSTAYAEMDHLSTDTLLQDLCSLIESPWGDLRGKPLDPRGLARRLRAYEVTPKVLRVGDKTVRGYSRADLHDAWSRYLPSCSDYVTDVTAQQSELPS